MRHCEEEKATDPCRGIKPGEWYFVTVKFVADWTFRNDLYPELSGDVIVTGTKHREDREAVSESVVSHLSFLFDDVYAHCVHPKSRQITKRSCQNVDGCARECRWCGSHEMARSPGPAKFMAQMVEEAATGRHCHQPHTGLFEKYKCVHGLGHGLTINLQHDVLKSLAFCDGGVFMEMIVSLAPVSSGGTLPRTSAWRERSARADPFWRRPR
ncbi:MAG: hypothetical protein ACR2M4_03560 [Actinomycetota bacterium]